MESTGTMSKSNSQRLEDWAKLEKNMKGFFVPIPNADIKKVSVVLCIDAKVLVNNTPSGREYVFEHAGAILDVDERDVDFLLSKRQGERQCCGGTDRGNKMFDLAQG